MAMLTEAQKRVAMTMRNFGCHNPLSSEVRYITKPFNHEGNEISIVMYHFYRCNDIEEEAIVKV